MKSSRISTLDSWIDRYDYIIDGGQKLPPMPDKFKTEQNRVHGCQSTVFLCCANGRFKRRRRIPGRQRRRHRAGLLKLLQPRLLRQRARDIAAFDIHAFFAKLGLDTNLSMGRRNGLAEMVQRVRAFAGLVAAEQESRS